MLLTARGQEVDKVLGLSWGPTTTSPSRSARANSSRASGRCFAAPNLAPPAVQLFRDGDLVIELGRSSATRAGRPGDVTALEFRLLKALVDAGGQVLARHALIRQVWGEDVFLSDRVIYTHINNLRRKVESDPSRPTLHSRGPRSGLQI